MYRLSRAAWSALVLVSVAVQLPAAETAKSSESSASGKLTGLRVEPNVDGEGFVIRGRDRRQQLFVTGYLSNGRPQDLTQKVTYKVEPEGIVSVSKTGYLTPLADGSVSIIVASQDGQTASVKGSVSGITEDPPINFKNQIVPIFTKLGCNSGGCHGKASGQNGFKLSLLGFYPDDDYEFLVKEGRGRRLNPASPDESLFLTKPVGKSPHGGGKRMDVDSLEYRLVAHWIEQGMPYGNADDPTVIAIKCVPDARVMGRDSGQQITVVATYSDGTTEDVTRMALFEPNDTEMAESGKTGLIKTLDLTGEVAVMARYQGQVSTFRATIPLGADLAGMPKPANFVDEAVFNKLRLLGIPPSQITDDATFIRRAYIDITGETPTAEEVTRFLAVSAPDKRDKLIDQLVDSPGYADLFANKWNMVLRNKKRKNEDRQGTFAFYRWIWNSLYENKPYDQFVREIIAASGDRDHNPATIWYREVSKNNEQVEDTAQLFLGLRIQCARCHHHPFERWSQNDYYSLSAFFTRVGNKTLPNITGNTVRDRRIFHNEGVATAKNPRSGQQLKPAGLGLEPFDIPADRDPRQYLVNWMAAKDNPFFARALVNRYWKHFFDRGIVEPEDDMRETNPPSNPELLDNLAKNFIANDFDLKWLVRAICKSKTYQLSSIPNDHNLKDKQNFSRYYPRRLKAEVLYDALHQVTSTTQAYSGLPAGTTALQLPDPSVGTYFLKVFGQPQAETACECERSQEANLAQSLHLLNSSEVQGKISNKTGRAAKLAADDKVADEQKIRDLYLWVYSRAPKDDELQIALGHIKKHEKTKQVAYEDIIWALLNTKEFLFNH